MMEFRNKTWDQERALYGMHNCKVVDCKFEGPADGESALKECTNVEIENCDFKLRYPIWHVKNVKINNMRMTDTCRASMWYVDNIEIKNSQMNGIKALRECNNITIYDSSAISDEFCWMCHNIKIKGLELSSVYPFLCCSNIEIEDMKANAKYCFQYAQDVTIRNLNIDTKDTFWHGKNVTVYDSVLKGEYLGWYSENLHLIRCKIIGIQPLCYCKGLVLEDCEMIDTNLSFENSDVKATIVGSILSIKNPISGYIHADSIGEIILDEHRRPDANCDIKTLQ